MHIASYYNSGRLVVFGSTNKPYVSAVACTLVSFAVNTAAALPSKFQFKAVGPSYEFN
jgi:hypothetical protein